jgi:hypothetical protein
MSITTPRCTPPRSRVARVDATNTICNTPRPKLLIWPSSTRGMSLHMHSTSLTLLSSLHVKGLTWRCYVWNNKAYKLAFTLLNFRGGTKATNNTPHVPLRPHGSTSQLLQATNGLGCMSHSPVSSPHICGRCPGPPLGISLHRHVQQRVDTLITSVTPPPFKTVYMAQLRTWNRPTYVQHLSYTFVLTSYKRVNPEVLRLKLQVL